MNISTNKNLSKTPSLQLKIPPRSYEAGRTEKASLASHELSYSNFAKLMDLSEGLLGCGASTAVTSSFLMKMQSFLIQDAP